MVSSGLTEGNQRTAQQERTAVSKAVRKGLQAAGKAAVLSTVLASCDGGSGSGDTASASCEFVSNLP